MSKKEGNLSRFPAAKAELPVHVTVGGEVGNAANSLKSGVPLRLLGFLSLLVFVALLFSSCCCAPEAVETTWRYYEPLTNIPRPPKPKDAVVSVLYLEPARPFQVIGRMSMVGEELFVERALQWNAGQAGADAVIIRCKETQYRMVNVAPPPGPPDSSDQAPTPPPHPTSQQTREYRRDVNSYEWGKLTSLTTRTSGRYVPDMQLRPCGYLVSADMIVYQKPERSRGSHHARR